MHRTLVLSLVLLVGFVPSALATACPQHYAGGKAPAIVRESLKPRTQELCFRAFAVMHSGVSRTPLWAAEHLLRSEVRAARSLARRDAFHEETRLPVADRARLADYERSGYDRGHLAPSGDMHDPRAQAESFSLANIVPQTGASNSGIWADIEHAVRDLAVSEGEIYVVTGPAFVGTRIARLKNRVLVPTHMWKVVYSPKRRQAGAYLVTNDTSRTWRAVSVTELARLTGIEALPGVPQQVRDRAMRLPEPQTARGRGRDGFTLDDLLRAVREAIEAVVRKLLR